MKNKIVSTILVLVISTTLMSGCVGVLDDSEYSTPSPFPESGGDYEEESPDPTPIDPEDEEEPEEPEEVPLYEYDYDEYLDGILISYIPNLKKDITDIDDKFEFVNNIVKQNLSLSYEIFTRLVAEYGRGIPPQGFTADVYGDQVTFMESEFGIYPFDGSISTYNNGIYDLSSPYLTYSNTLKNSIYFDVNNVDVVNEEVEEYYTWNWATLNEDIDEIQYLEVFLNDSGDPAYVSNNLKNLELAITMILAGYNIYSEGDEDYNLYKNHLKGLNLPINYTGVPVENIDELIVYYAQSVGYIGITEKKYSKIIKFVGNVVIGEDNLINDKSRFIDVSNNGIFDSEIFIDINMDGQYNSGEEFYDLNNDGIFNLGPIVDGNHDTNSNFFKNYHNIINVRLANVYDDRKLEKIIPFIGYKFIPVDEMKLDEFNEDYENEEEESEESGLSFEELFLDIEPKRINSFIIVNNLDLTFNSLFLYFDSDYDFEFNMIARKYCAYSEEDTFYEFESKKILKGSIEQRNPSVENDYKDNDYYIEEDIEIKNFTEDVFLYEEFNYNLNKANYKYSLIDDFEKKIYGFNSIETDFIEFIFIYDEDNISEIENFRFRMGFLSLWFVW